MAKPKWFRNDQHLKKGDIILFNKSDSVLSGEYKLGMNDSVEFGSDNLIRTVNVKYSKAK